MTDQSTDSAPALDEMDFAAFEQAINAPKDQSEPEAQEPEVSDVEGEATDEKKPDEAAKPPKKSFQDRMDEVTKARREAERQADEARRENAELKAQIEQLSADREYEGDPLTQAEIDQIVETKLAERENKRIAEEQARTAQEREKQFQERMAKAAEGRDDYFSKVIEGAQKNEWACTNDMLAAIQESEAAGEIAYHLANDPDLSRRIAALSPHSQVREIGKIEAALAASPTPPKPVNHVPKAPPPPPSLRGTGGSFKVSPDTEDFAAFEREYAGKP